MRKLKRLSCLFLAIVFCLSASVSAQASGMDVLTLYARWQTQVTFDANGGVLAGGATDAERALAGRNSGSIMYTVNQTVSTGLIGSRSGYTFVQWNTSPDGRGTNIDSYGTVTGPVTFYAIYYKSDYAYTGSVQTFTVPINGWYRIQCWGASGGGNHPSGSQSAAGWGGYAMGEFQLSAGQVLHVYVGGMGSTGGAAGGWNGGGRGGSYEGGSSGGGGGTDVRIGSEWSSRIIVAGGGGGSDDVNAETSHAGNGGGITGTAGYLSGGGGAAGTQNSGYAVGYGGPGTYIDAGGGGGGYWGGRGATSNDAGGGGGSGYVAGFGGCVSHYSGLNASNGALITGGSGMPNWNGGNMSGVWGHGYVRVTLISTM